MTELVKSLIYCFIKTEASKLKGVKINDGLLSIYSRLKEMWTSRKTLLRSMEIFNRTLHSANKLSI